MRKIDDLARSYLDAKTVYNEKPNKDVVAIINDTATGFTDAVLSEIDPDRLSEILEAERDGRWVLHPGSNYAWCSECRCDTALYDAYRFPIGRNSMEEKAPAYCPHCGAKMDADEGGEAE